jgi:uncharacterized protein (TIGR02246 family)
MDDDARQVAEPVLQRLEQAWNAADGAAFAAPFTDDADFVDIRGDHHRTRDAIGHGHQQIMETIYRGSRVRYTLEQARRLADGVILAHSSAVLDVPGGPMAGTHRAIASWVLVPAGGEWRIAAFHNTRAGG